MNNPATIRGWELWHRALIQSLLQNTLDRRVKDVVEQERSFTSRFKPLIRILVAQRQNISDHTSAFNLIGEQLLHDLAGDRPNFLSLFAQGRPGFLQTGNLVWREMGWQRLSQSRLGHPLVCSRQLPIRVKYLQ